MSEQKKVNTSNCGLDFEHHIRGLIKGMVLNGMGGKCEGTYQALLEVADLLRRHYGHSYEVQGLIQDHDHLDDITFGGNDVGVKDSLNYN